MSFDRSVNYCRNCLLVTVFFVSLSLHCAAAGSSSGLQASPAPNILLIVLDDAGYGDIAGFSEADVPTPNLKTLAEQGVRFTRFYADGSCRPARVALITGKQASGATLSPDFVGISPELETLPEKLKTLGYSTHHIGKWHLGDTTMLAWPSAQGFDQWFGFLNQFLLRNPNSERRYHRPSYINPWLQKNDGELKQYQGHLEDILADAVIEKIQKVKQSGQPWFINYWTFAPHNPVTPSEAFRLRYPEGKAGQYHAMLDQLDYNIGRVLSELDKTGQADNTIVVVLSDNGGTNEMIPNNGPYGGAKGLYSEGGTRTPMIIRWPGHIKANDRYDGIATLYDIFPTLTAAAGGEVTEESDGVDLLPLVQQGRPRPPQNIFWEAGTNYIYQYSVLSADGRWRLDNGALYDLQVDPKAEMDVAEPQAKIFQSLRQQFLQWRRQTRHMDLDITLLSKASDFRQEFMVTGDSFRRSPGYGGFTFVSSISVEQGVIPEGVIAEQSGMWSLKLGQDQRLYLRMNNEELVSKPITVQGCTPLVVSSYYSRSKLQPQQDTASWFLMVGKEQVLVEQRPLPALFPERFLEPTYVGRSADGKQTFSGRLEIPHFYNDFYYLNDPWKVERDPLWLADTVCQGD